MKNRLSLCVIMVMVMVCGTRLAADGLSVSGLLDSTVSLRTGAGDAPEFSYGVEEYANIRFQAKLRDRAAFFGAVNCIAATGDYATAAAQTAAFVGGENYTAAIELERLYFRLNFDAADFDAGLLRLPFGYGQVWGPSDFLNPKNPLRPDARPRAVLGGGLAWYPLDSLKLLGFGAAPRNPFSCGGEGGLAGIAMDHHWDRASLQVLYAFESPQAGSDKGIHRAGISVKADVEVGLMMDALYTYNVEAETGIDGLALSAGIDYSFIDGRLIVIAEYLYNGETSSTALGYGGNFVHEHYVYSGFTWRFNDYTTAGAALVSGFDDVSFTPVLNMSHDLFQGATLIVAAQIPLDRDLFSGDGRRGELGPLPPGHNAGRYFDCTATIRLRF